VAHSASESRIDARWTAGSTTIADAARPSLSDHRVRDAVVYAMGGTVEDIAGVPREVETYRMPRADDPCAWPHCGRMRSKNTWVC